MTDKILKAWGKKHVNYAFPSLNGTSFSQNFGAEKGAKTHGNSPPDVHLSADNSAGKFHLSVIKISLVGQVGHGISTPLCTDQYIANFSFKLQPEKSYNKTNDALKAMSPMSFALVDIAFSG